MIQDQGFWVELEPSDNRLGLLITQLWFPPQQQSPVRPCVTTTSNVFFLMIFTALGELISSFMLLQGNIVFEFHM